ncbi:MAG TPA: MOSC N-terminal beta barrel domain-containing protein [Stellaceae bacterium]|nr:MOSC N-terminal beta barrel domain-containing protein [Stellaceae bacterium]
MTEATVKELYRYPVKGVRGERLDSLAIDPALGVKGDRRFGIKRKPDQPDQWATKVHFRVCMNTPAMAAQGPIYLDSAGPATPHTALDRRWLMEVATVLDEPEVGLLDTRGAYNLVDTDPFKHGPTVSFLNLASLRALEAETGWTIDPKRFRMNVWFDSGEAFSELAWSDEFPGTKRIAVGNIPMRMQDACERCLAIEANPATGERDLPVLDALESLLKKRGYRGSPHRGSFHVMGFLAVPLTSGAIEPGQTIRLL